MDEDISKAFNDEIYEQFTLNEMGYTYQNLVSNMPKAATKSIPRKQKPQPEWFSANEEELLLN